MAVDDGIEPLAVGGRDILHIAHILQAPLYLERGGASLYQLLQIVTPVEVAQRQQMAVALHHPALGILERKAHAAELSTLATIGTTPEAILRGIALAGIAHAEGTVDEHLELYVGHLPVDLGYLADGELTGQHDTGEPQLVQPAHLLRRAVVGLGRGVEG